MVDMVYFNKLVKAKEDLDHFRVNYPLFYCDLIVLLRQHIDWYMIENGFSIKLRSFFKVFIGEERRKIKISDNGYIEIKNQLDELFIKHIECYSDFSDVIRRHVRSGVKKMGYNTITRLLFGEPILSIFIGSNGFRTAYSLSGILEIGQADEEFIVDYLINMFERTMSNAYKIKVIEGDTEDKVS